MCDDGGQGESSGNDEANDSAIRVEVHILSGGVGASAELLAHTVLAQFPGFDVPLIVHPHVHTRQEVEEVEWLPLWLRRVGSCCTPW